MLHVNPRKLEILPDGTVLYQAEKIPASNASDIFVSMLCHSTFELGEQHLLNYLIEFAPSNLKKHLHPSKRKSSNKSKKRKLSKIEFEDESEPSPKKIETVGTSQLNGKIVTEPIKNADLERPKNVRVVTQMQPHTSVSAKPPQLSLDPSNTSQISGSEQGTTYPWYFLGK